MTLHRIRLRPDSAWRTPWQADTLTGMLCSAIAHIEGGAFLRERVIAPSLDGKPPFVLSNAFPGDWLPTPAILKTMDWAPEERKPIKKARWLSQETFRKLQRGERPAIADIAIVSPISETTQLHNTLSRTGNQSGPGGLYPREEFHLGKGVDHFTVYARFEEPQRELLTKAFHELATGGFGADRSSGKGQFEILGDFEASPELDKVSEPDGLVSLSTFQPGASDPTDGSWNTFTKYGKLGPDFGLGNVFKRPLVLLEPGASFRTRQPRSYLGRAIPMEELLPASTASQLRTRGVEVIHSAFALAIPFHFPGDAR